MTFMSQVLEVNKLKLAVNSSADGDATIGGDSRGFDRFLELAIHAKFRERRPISTAAPCRTRAFSG